MRGLGFLVEKACSKMSFVSLASDVLSREAAAIVVDRQHDFGLVNGNRDVRMARASVQPYVVQRLDADAM